MMNRSDYFKKKKASLRPKSKPSDVASLLNRVSHQLGLETKVHELALLRLWPEVVEAVAGELFVDNSQAVAVSKKNGGCTLKVRVNQALLAGELRLHTQALLARLNAYEKQTGLRLTRLETVVGSLHL